MKALAQLIATGFGLGRVPLAPGTAASLAVLPLGWFFAFLGARALCLAIVLSVIVGVWASQSYAKTIGVKDPSECVIDEVAGQWIALAPIALEGKVFAWQPLVMAFLLFRLLDMTKPWPVHAMEKLEGGLGIMADDIMAGLIAAAALYVMLAIGLV